VTRVGSDEAAGRTASDPAGSEDPGELLARFWRLVNGFSTYFAVLAADELGVFEALADGPAAVSVLAGRLGADPARLRALLVGNLAAGTVSTDGETFALTPLSVAHLVPSHTGYLGPLLRQSPGPVENWPALASTVRGADPPRDITREPGTYLRALVEATFPLQLAVARAVVAGELSGRLPETATVVDLGAGCAPWAIAVLESRPRARAVVNDLAGVIAAGERELGARGLADRVTFLEGSYWSVEVPQDEADLVVLGHVCRAEGDDGARTLVGRAAGALRRGGSLVVTEYLLDDDLAGPVQAQLLGTTMLTNTRRGATFTRRQARAWIEAAGLRLVTETSPVPPTAVLVATRGTT
jgi:O-methyltransferase domain